MGVYAGIQLYLHLQIIANLDLAFLRAFRGGLAPR